MTLITRPGYLWNETVWNPSMISTALWLDAADASTITTVDGAVSQWNDKSGNGRNLSQSTAAARPIYTSNGLNSKNILTFESGDHFGTRSMPNAANEIVLYCVLSPTLISAYHNLLDNANSTPMIWIDPSNRWEINTVTGLVVSGFTGATHIAGFRIRTTSSTLTFWGNGGTASTANSATSPWANPSTFSFFNRSGSSTFRGTFAEMIWIDGAVSDANRQRIEGYLAHKWGLEANLPNDHPYKTTGPTP